LEKNGKILCKGQKLSNNVHIQKPVIYVVEYRMTFTMSKFGENNLKNKGVMALTSKNSKRGITLSKISAL